jgi:hypothetical protein
MADEDSSDFTFCKVSSTENDGQPGSPTAIPVASLTLKDGPGDSLAFQRKMRRKLAIQINMAYLVPYLVASSVVHSKTIM